MEEEVTELLATVCELGLRSVRGIPGCAVSDHSVGDHKQLTHAGGEGNFRGLAAFSEPLVEDADRGVAPAGGQGRHIQRHAHGTTASPDHSLTSQRTGVPVQRRDAGERSDLLPVQLPEFGKLSDQRA